MFSPLLSYDTYLLRQARELISPEYATWVQVLSESVVLWWAGLLLFIWFSWHFRHDTEGKRNALRIFFTIISVFVIYSIINFWIPAWRPNPQTVVGGIAPLIPHPIDNSFPSGHALFSAALLVGVWRYYRNPLTLSVTIILGILTVVLRVIGWVHYPWDILGGLFFGTLGALLIWKWIVWNWMEHTLYPWLIRIASWLKM